MIQRRHLLSYLKFCLVASCFFLYLSASAQFSDDFEDGDFTNNPTWSGDTRFIIDNGVLRSNTGTLAAATTYFLSTPSTQATSAQWDFFINLRFATSGSNYADIYLMANNANLNATNISGYFVRVGDTQDDISLFRITNGIATKIIDGQDAVVGSSSNNPFNIRVRRDVNNNWTLGYNNGTNTINYTPGGSVNDANHTTCTHFGIRITQSTASSVVNNHFFDNFVVGNIVIDNAPPIITGVNVLSNTQLEVVFSEAISQATATTLTNYSVTNGINNPINIVLSAFDRVTLTFATALVQGITYTLSVQNVQDLANNTMVFTQRDFVLPFTPLLNELLITEIMADPDPVTTILPNQEYFEIHNRSNKTISLRNCQVKRNNDNPINFPNVSLAPNEYALVCANAHVSLFQAIVGTGRIIGLGTFPALTNTGARLSLINANNVTIFTVNYSYKWYKNSIKANGGWSLEMIDIQNPCGEIDNWTSSENANGGTPAAVNSVNANNPDNTAPFVVRADVLSTQTIRVTFSEKMDSLSLINANITIDNNISVASRTLLEAPDYNRMSLTLAQALQPRISYTITIQNARDCSGNLMQTRNQAIVGIPETADSLDVVVNEILFNPHPNGVDFVEFYNNSDKFINLKGWDIARIREGLIADRKRISNEDFLLAPRTYIVFTPDANVLKANYPRGVETVFNNFSLPSYNDDAGGVVLINAQNQVFQRFDYTERMHNRILRDREGVSLERISFTAPTNNPNSWQSASATEGFATPGYVNSQLKRDFQDAGEITIFPKVLTPDGDGQDDFTTINYQFANGGGVMSITIYDVQGREIRRLLENQTVSTAGFITWDGVNAEGKKTPIGYYVLWIEVFDLTGRKQTFKETLAVGMRF